MHDMKTLRIGSEINPDNVGSEDSRLDRDWDSFFASLSASELRELQELIEANQGLEKESLHQEFKTRLQPILNALKSNK